MIASFEPRVQKEKPIQATAGVPARKGALRLLMAVLGRGTPLELAKAAVFLASDESAFVVGTELLVDGGVKNL